MKTQKALPGGRGYKMVYSQKIIFLLICLMIPLWAFTQDDKTIVICHHPPDNPDNTVTLVIGLDALQEHLDHGDEIGPCFEGELNGDIFPYFDPPDIKIEEEIGAELTSLVEKFTELGSIPSDDIYVISGDRVLIEIIAENEYSLQSIVNALASYDAIIYEDFDHVDDLILTVLFPISKLEDFNEDLYQGDVVSFVRPVYTPILKSGIVTSQGDQVMQSDNARNAFEVDGSGVKVCVMSDSYDAKMNAQKGYKNGDLPLNVDVSLDYPSEFGSHFYVVDEGQAMLEIVHDIAPGAELGFRTGFFSIEHMANGIQILKNDHNCNIIVDDITHLAEPFFQDGLISNAVNEVTSGEDWVYYFSSAGNAGDFGYESQFSPAPGNESFHYFNTIDGTDQSVRFEKATVYIFVLQWDDVYKSLGPDGNTGAQNDLDISLVDANGNTLVAMKRNNLGGDPIEVMPIKVENGGAMAYINIERAHGTENVHFKYIVFVGGMYFQILNELSSVSTIVGQANAVGAYAVGAAAYDQTPAFGINPPIIEPFSSYGGTMINNIDRHKPDFVAPDRVNTSVTTIGEDIDGDSFLNFAGTSAAAPHAAAVSSLISQAMEKFEVPGLDVGEIMKTSALDMYQSGYDPVSGNGFLLADEAIMSFASPKPTLTELVIPASKTPGVKAFVVTIKGENFTSNSQVLLGGNTLPAKDVKFIDRSTLTAKIPAFSDDPLVQINNPFITPSELDGGLSNSMSFSDLPRRTISVKAENKTKKFGEKNPDFTVTLEMNDVPLEESGLPAEEIDRLMAVDFEITTTATEWNDPTGTYQILPVGINSEITPPEILDDYEFDYQKGYLTIEKIPLTIKPNIDSYLPIYYGDIIEDVDFFYDLYSDGEDNNDNIWNLTELLNYIAAAHESTFPENITNALVDRARLFVNRGRLFVNESGSWLVSEAALQNRARLFVNGDISINAIDIYSELVEDYIDNPDGTITDRGRLLVNAESLYNGDAGIWDEELNDRARLFVNEGGLPKTEEGGEAYSDINIIMDEEDYNISKLYSINLISGIDVNDGDEFYEGASQYIKPGAFISPAADNFDISYQDELFDISPVELNVTVDHKLMFLEDPVMPKFTCNFDGFQYDDNEENVFLRIEYQPIEITEIGEFEIKPVNFIFFNEKNYEISVYQEGSLTVRHLKNGRIITATENEHESNDLLILNSDGSNPSVLAPLAGSVLDPAFSPDGSEIVFTVKSGEQTNLWKINSDGTEITQLTSDDVSGVGGWSLDGSKIAFIRDGDLALMNKDGTKAKILMATEADEYWPFFNPEGNKLYFTRNTTEGKNAIFKIDFSPAYPDLIHWWPGNGNVSNIVSRNDGLLQNGATYGPGWLNKAFQLDGMDDYVMVPDSPNLNFGINDFTISVWVNFQTLEGEQVIIEKWIQKSDGNSSGWTLTKLEDNTLRFAIQNGIDPEMDLDVIPASLFINSWNHIAVTRESNLITLYWVGLPLGFVDCAYNLDNQSSIKMGHRGNPSDTPGSEDDRGFYLNGFIDEVQFFNRALKASEIEMFLIQEESQITLEDNFLQQPDFARDGSKIIYTIGPDASSSGEAILSINPDGSDPATILEDWVGGASSSPDGEYITLIKDNDAYKTLWIMNSDGTGLKEIFAPVPFGVIQPNWGTFPDVIRIPDPNFEQALNDLGIDTDGIINQQILRSDAEAVSILDISDPINNSALPNVHAKIADLTGIEAFSNLTRLYCQFNQLKNLDLSKNTALIQLWCFNNQITALDFSENTVLDDLLCYENQLISLNVSQNIGLTHLNCYGNQLTSLDVSKNVALTGLSCSGNPLGSLDVSSNTALTHLDCASIQISSLNISENADLIYLHCPFNELTILNVSQNTELINLLCAGNQLTSLDISLNSALTELKCEGNQLTDLNVKNGNNANFTNFVANDNYLTCITVDDKEADHSDWWVDEGVIFSEINCSEIVYITDPNFEQALIDLQIDGDGIINHQILKSEAESRTSLNLMNISISDLTGIEAFINLTWLHLANNPDLREIDLSSNTALKDLSCQENNLTTLNISNNAALEFLVCSEAGLEYLDVTGNPLLAHLSCGDNQLTNLDVTYNTKLELLHCHNNNLSNLNLSQNTALTTLWCSNNQLNSLDLTNNILLEVLTCSDNNLGSLNLSQNKALQVLLCRNAQLISLDLSQNSTLTNIDCAYNDITSLDISNIPNLTSIICESNNLTELDARNGNNLALMIYARFNNLSCISVDDEGVDHSEWWVDPNVIFSNDCSISHSGERIISGTVVGDDGTPLPGVAIMVQGTTIGTITDLNGEYSIIVTGDDATIVVSLIDYYTVNEFVGNRTIVNITMTALETMFITESATTMSYIEDGNVRLFPNPVEDWLTIEFIDESVDLLYVSINCYDEWSNVYDLLLSSSTEIYGFEVDFNSLPTGTFYVQLYDGIEVRVFRIMKE